MSGHNNSDGEHDEEGPLLFTEPYLLSEMKWHLGPDAGAEEAASSEEAPATGSGFFSGRGHKLGGEGGASAYVPGAREEVEYELVIRRLTFWHDGFTVEDGPLMRYDDPATEDDYVPSKPFSGTGNRLGAPASAPSVSGARAAPAPASSSATINPRFEVGTKQPTTSIQVRLADGTRLIERTNFTHTVGDLRGLIDA
ncbi:hypothetical protein DFH08DRAFT_1023822 [Mycena albidolilacea]|uniref:SEP domain-containing protein n=1 Tax=Mycena albidolilacea TaxID=1033008 RepID=A0AAD7EK62_9AGAR|nr:hypothetical protein DFH08DRAFT_1023822 [Mycena albidolilacea]